MGGKRQTCCRLIRHALNIDINAESLHSTLVHGWQLNKTLKNDQNKIPAKHTNSHDVFFIKFNFVGFWGWALAKKLIGVKKFLFGFEQNIGPS